MTDEEAFEMAFDANATHYENSHEQEAFTIFARDMWKAARHYYQQSEWREQAYARLGAVRDRMRPLDVESVQAFLADRDR